MVTYFNRKDLSSFGKYLLSEDRTNRILSNHNEGDSITKEERLQTVYHADAENWLSEEGKSSIPTSFKVGDIHAIKKVLIPEPPKEEAGLPAPKIDGWEHIVLRQTFIDGVTYDVFEYMPEGIDLCEGGNGKRIDGDQIEIVR